MKPAPRRTRWRVALLVASVVIAVSPVGIHVPVGASVGTGPATGALEASHPAIRPWARAAGGPTLTLTPSPSAGNPPLTVNATVAADGGVPPYTVDVCFGTIDHTSPTVPCGTTDPGWTGASALTFTHVYPGPGNFSVIAVLRDSVGAGAGATALIVVTTDHGLTAAATEAVNSGTAPLGVEFDDTVSGGTPPIAIQWAFGDGSFASGLPGASITHVYRNAGVFDPSFVVSDGAGHQTRQELPAVTVVAGASPSSPVYLSGNSWWWTAGAAGSVALFLGVLALRLVQARRWRREGNELVEEAIRGDPPSGDRPRAR